MNILQINASARREGANSTRVANSVVARLQSAHPTAKLTLRDLAVTPQPVLDEVALGALFTPADARTPEQVARVKKSYTGQALASYFNGAKPGVNTISA